MRKISILLAWLTLLMGFSGNVDATTYVTDCGPLSMLGEAYVLNNDISASGTCFTIGADGITLDGAGYSISGGGSEGYGVYASGRNNVIIKNLGISGFSSPSETDYDKTAGIYVTGSNDFLITQNNVTDIFNGYGIKVVSSNNVNITFNRILRVKANNEDAYYVGKAINSRELSYSLISGNYLYDNTRNMMIARASHDNVISNNELWYGTYFGGIDLDGIEGRYIVYNNKIFNNTVYYSDWGIILNQADNNIIINNTIIGTGWYISPAKSYQFSQGLTIEGENNVIKNIEIYDTIAGKAVQVNNKFYNAANNTFENIYIYNVTAGDVETGTGIRGTAKNVANNVFKNITIDLAENWGILFNGDSTNNFGGNYNNTFENITILRTSTAIRVLNTYGENTIVNANLSAYDYEYRVDANSNLKIYNGISSSENEIKTNDTNANATLINNDNKIIYGIENQVYPDYATSFIPSDSLMTLRSIDMNVFPSSDWVNLTVYNWSTSYKKWNESSENVSITTEHAIGNLSANSGYRVMVNNVFWKSLRSNATGYVNFTYDDGFSETQFEIDPAPTVDFVSPTLANNSNTLSNWVFVNVTSNVNLSQALLEWGNSSGYTNVTMTVVNASVNTYAHINMTSLSDYNYGYTVWVQDNAGNWNQSEKRFVTLDATPPDTVLNAYSPDPTNDNAPTYSGTATDSLTNVVDIEYMVDSGVWTDVDAFTPDLSVSFTFTTPPLSDGTHTIDVRAKDNVGNWETTYASDSLIVDITPPDNPTSVWSTSHSIGVWSSDNTVDISWAGASDSVSGVDGYSFEWSTSSTTLPNTIKNVEETTTSTTSSPLGDGNSWYFHIRTVDNAGNWNSTAVHEGPFYIDKTLPIITYNNPTAGGATRWYNSDPGNIIDIDFGWVANSPLDYAQWQIGAGGWNYISTADQSSDYTADWNVTWSSLAEGENQISIEVADTAGNVLTHSYVAGTSGFLYRKDTTPPNITITSPENKTYNTILIDLNYSVSDASGIDWVGYSLDGANNITTSREVTTFSNSTGGDLGGATNITFTSAGSNTSVYLKVPKNVTVTSAMMDVSEFGTTAVTTRDPTSDSGAWLNGTDAYTSDDLYASTKGKGYHVYSGYGFNIGSDAIDKVEVGVEYYTVANDKIYVYVSTDGGATYSSYVQATVWGVDDDEVEWLDVTSLTSWDASKLSDTYFRVQVKHQAVAAANFVYLDYIPVRVTYISYPTSPSIDIGNDGDLEYATIKLQSNETENLAEVEARSAIWASFYTNISAQIMWNISSIPSDSELLNATLCLFWNHVTSWDNDVNFSRVDDQYWDESITPSEWNSQVLTDITTTINWSDITENEWGCLNVIDVVKTDYDLGNKNTSIRLMDLDYVVSSADGGIDNSDYRIEIGMIDDCCGQDVHLRYYTKRWTDPSKRPYLTITYAKIQDFSAELNSLLSTCPPDAEENCIIPINVTSDSAGIVQLDALSVKYYSNATLTGLSEDQHNVTVYANDTAGNLNSSTVYFTVETGAILLPTNLTAIWNNDGTITLTWNGSSALYEIYVTTNYSVGFNLSNPHNNTSNTSWTDEDAPLYGQRYYRVGVSGKPPSNKTVGKFDIDLYSGFNLVSLPLIPHNNSINKVMHQNDTFYPITEIASPNAGGDYDIATFYPENPPNYWWSPDGLTIIGNDIRYWFKLSQYYNFTLVGEVPTSNRSVNLTQGFNLVGWTSLEERKLWNAIIQNASDYNVTGIATRSSNGEYMISTFYPENPPNYWWSVDNFTTLEPGKGYWFKVNRTFTWNYEP